MLELQRAPEAGGQRGASSAPDPGGPSTLADLRRAVAALPPGSSVTIPCAALLAVLGNGHPEGTAPEGPPPDRLLTVKQVADRLSTSPKFIYAHARRGDYPFTRHLGKKVLRFSEQGLARWLARVR